MACDGTRDVRHVCTRVFSPQHSFGPAYTSPRFTHLVHLSRTTHLVTNVRCLGPPKKKRRTHACPPQSSPPAPHKSPPCRPRASRPSSSPSSKCTASAASLRSRSSSESSRCFQTAPLVSWLSPPSRRESRTSWALVWIQETRTGNNMVTREEKGGVPNRESRRHRRQAYSPTATQNGSGGRKDIHNVYQRDWVWCPSAPGTRQWIGLLGR